MADISLPELQAMNKKITVDKADPADVAKQFVTDKGLLTAEPSITTKLTIGSANFYEQELVANMAAQVLKAHGADVTLKTKLGARPVVDAAMDRGDIDLYIEYVGSYLAFKRGDDKSPNATDATKAIAELNTLIQPKGLIMLDPSPAEDKDGLVVTKATADKYKLAKISDLLAVPDALTMGGPPECPTYAYCIPGYTSAYGLQFKV
jgi:osmoprotectant transport system substrate-binding protein